MGQAGKDSRFLKQHVNHISKGNSALSDMNGCNELVSVGPEAFSWGPATLHACVIQKLVHFKHFICLTRNMFGSICLANLCEVNSFVNVLLNAMVRKVKTAASSKASLEGQAASVEEQEDEQRPFGKRPREERLATLLDKGFRPVSVVQVS